MTGNFNPRTPCGVRPIADLQNARKAANFNPRTPCGVRLDQYHLIPVIIDISIHAPLAGCDLFALTCRKSQSKFQSTHPLRGATPRPCRSSRRPTHFNPRTPCGVRLVGTRQDNIDDRISIHAPLAGCDTAGRKWTRRDGGFQSTHSLRGATGIIMSGTSAERKISIHAPLAGCDAFVFFARRAYGISIHAPLAGCDHPDQYRRLNQPISIHAPLAGCDACLLNNRLAVQISIHAPLAGCDHEDSTPTALRTYFNPRTPCGVRRSKCGGMIPHKGFQSTHPLRGATAR